MKQDFNWKEIEERLSKGVVNVTFTKKSDGSIRNMDCTRAEYLLPENAKDGHENPNIMLVLDMDKNDLRSFCKDHVSKVEFYDG